MRNDCGRKENQVHVRARREDVPLLLCQLQEHLRQGPSQIRAPKVKGEETLTQELGKGTGSAPVQPAGEAPMASFVLSLIAGLLVLAGSGMMMTFSYGGPYYGMMGGYYGMMGGYYGMMQGYGYGGWFYGVAALGVISGILVLVGAIMIYTRPSTAPTWGLVVLVFSILSFFGMGGFFIGAILGVVGGILAMTWRTAVAQK